MLKQKYNLAYIDNSTISDLRLKDGILDVNRIKFTFNIIKKFNIAQANIILTNKLFLEVIGHGNLRKKIIKNTNEIDEARKKTVSRGQLVSINSIQIYCKFLEDFFNSKIRARLSKNTIYSDAMDNLKKHPFIDAFYHFEQRILIHAKKISTSPQEYENFINDLVNDSIIRNCLDLLTKIDPVKINSINKPDNATNILTFLVKKYANNDVINDSLLLLFDGLRCYAQRSLNVKEPAPKLFRLNDDFADAEPYAIVFAGKTIEEKHYPASLFTKENMKTVKKRLNDCFVTLVTARQNKRFNGELLLGRVRIINFENHQDSEISLIDIIDKNIPKSSYESIKCLQNEKN